MQSPTLHLVCVQVFTVSHDQQQWMEKVGLMNRLHRSRILISVFLAFIWLLLVELQSRSLDAGKVKLPLLARQHRDAPFLPPALKLSLREPWSDSEGRAPESKRIDICEGRYIYMYNLPKMFNEQFLKECESLSPSTNMCTALVNEGFGPSMEDTEQVFQGPAWYATHQFVIEVLYHNRIKRYECLTQDSSKADLLYVPYYGGLELSRHLWSGANITEKDRVSRALESFLLARPEWNRFDGHDHFMVNGRMTWDFRRRTDEESDWGNKLMLLPGIFNLTTLLVESSPTDPNDYAVPYPTYFHPSTVEDIVQWQKFIRGVARSSLFCFAGAPRPGMSSSIRSQLMSHCEQSEFCTLLDCGKIHRKCNTPSNVMKVFKESVFCLQPPGDTPTRRSTFDSILAGCIPVFFHVYSAYSQYGWHFPSNHTTYSVFIDENDVRTGNVSVEHILRSIPTERIEQMREAVIRLIPNIVYAMNDNHLTQKDAFDLAIEGVIRRVDRYKRSFLSENSSSPVKEIWRTDPSEKMALWLQLKQTFQSPTTGVTV